MAMKIWAPKEPWQQLYKSNNIKAELDKIYTADFFIEFATHFDKGPHPYELFKAVIYGCIWWRKPHETPRR